MEVELDEQDVEVDDVDHRVEDDRHLDSVLVEKGGRKMNWMTWLRVVRGKRRRRALERFSQRREGFDRVKNNEDCHESVRCRLVARDFHQPLREGPRDDLCASVLPLEAIKVLFSTEPEETEENLK